MKVKFSIDVLRFTLMKMQEAVRSILLSHMSGEGQILNFLANRGLRSKALRDYVINDT